MKLTEIIKTLKDKYGIAGEKSDLDIASFVASNDWDRMVGKDGHVAEGKEEYITKKLDIYCQHYRESHRDKAQYLLRKLQAELPKTHGYLTEYMIDSGLQAKDVYYLTDFLLYALPGEINLSDDAEVKHLMESAFDDLSKNNADLFADFLNWLLKHHGREVAYRNYYFTEKRYTMDTDAYDEDAYLEILYCLFNSEYIEDNDMYVQAADSKDYIDTWLFIALHFLCALRASDLVRLPHPRLPYDPETVLENVKSGEWSDGDARLVLHSVEWTIRDLGYKPHKTSSHSGISDIKFHVPMSLEVHVGTLFAIAEAHHQIAGKGAEEPLIRVITKYEQINKYMGEEIGDLFLESDFKTRSANKSFMQMIYLLTDDVLGKDEFSVKGYMLASLARSHKGSYGTYAQTTATYLKDAKMNGYSPAFVARELFERGSLSFIPSMLLKMITDDQYSDLSVRQQTSAIKALDMTPYEVERMVALSDKAFKQAQDLTKDIYQTLDKNSIIKILHRIGNGNAGSKQGECLCLMTAMQKLCPYADRSSCIGCRYEISTKSTVYMLASEMLRLKERYKDAGSDLEREKFKSLMLDTVAPTLDAVLTCAKEEYGEEVRDSLIEIIKEMQHAD